MVTSSCKFPHTRPATLPWCDPASEENEQREDGGGWSQGWVCSSLGLGRAVIGGLEFNSFVCCCSEAIINACLSAWGRVFLRPSGGRKCYEEEQWGIVFSVKWQQRSQASMDEKQATVASFLTQTLKLVMKVSSFSCHYNRHERRKTLLFAVKRTHNKLLLFHPKAFAALLLQLLDCVSLFPSWFNELKWDETHSFPQDRTIAL